MSKKKKILIMSDSYNVFTGFANVARHVSNHLHESGKYEVGYLGWFHAPLNNIKAPFTYYTTIKGHQDCCKRGDVVMKHEPGKNPQYFQTPKGVLLPLQDGPPCFHGRVLEADKYAFSSLHGILLDFQPDIVWALGDCWMQYHTQFMSVRPSFKWVSYFPIDGAPMPGITEMGNQSINWVETIDRSDVPVAYCDFGRDTMIETGKTYGKDLSKTKVIYHGNDNNIFKPLDNKVEIKKKAFNIDENVFLIGCFSRNQPRKAFHKLMEALAIGKKKGYWDGKTIKCFFHAPIRDVGWNLPGLIKHHDIADIIILNDKLQVGTGPTDEQMNELYNACDLMSLPSRGEGWGLTYSEAMAAGTPVLMSSYSAHHDWAMGGAARINTAALDAEPLTNIERAIVDVDDYCEKIKAFYDNITRGEYQDKFGILQGYKTEFPVTGDENLNMSVRESFSTIGKEITSKCLSWDDILKAWDELLDNVDVSTNRPWPQLNIPKPVNINELLDKEKKDRILFVMPGTFGDVFLSTAVIDSIKKNNPDKDIYFATSPQFKGILEGNSNIYKILDYNQAFENINLCNQLFEMTFTPHHTTQRSNNWSKNGHGKHLTQVYADHCGVELGKPFIQILQYQNAPEGDYMVIHVKTGQKTKDWHGYQKLVNRIDIPVVQVGAKEDPKIKGVIDARGKTIQETAGIIQGAKLFIGGDSICSHLAGYTKTDRILIYASTFPNLTAYPFKDSGECTILEPNDRFGCDRPCHEAQCIRNKNTCSINIQAKEILSLIETKGITLKDAPKPTISGYTTTYNPNKWYPWRQSIKSMLAFCDEVVVVDGGSGDGTFEELKEWKNKEPKLKVYKRRWKDDEPMMDGMQKAYARALCTKEYCWQQDADEIVHENDHVNIFKIIEDMPDDIDMVTLPVLDLYGTTKTVRCDRGLYKWRLSRNNPAITHGIPKQLRKTNKDGKVYCDKNLCDGCFPINSKSGEMVQNQMMFFSPETLQLMQTDVSKYKEVMTGYFKTLPSIWHYSWNNLERRINIDLEFWDKQWATLDQSSKEKNRFLGDLEPTPENIKERAEYFKDKKLDGTPMDLITIDWIEEPEVMKEK